MSGISCDLCVPDQRTSPKEKEANGRYQLQSSSTQRRTAGNPSDLDSFCNVRVHSVESPKYLALTRSEDFLRSKIREVGNAHEKRSGSGPQHTSLVYPDTPRVRDAGTRSVPGWNIVGCARRPARTVTQDACHSGDCSTDNMNSRTLGHGRFSQKDWVRPRRDFNEGTQPRPEFSSGSGRRGNVREPGRGGQCRKHPPPTYPPPRRPTKGPGKRAWDIAMLSWIRDCRIRRRNG